MSKGDLPVPGDNVRPHMVILGAGASRACCPSGDRNGRKLPVIADFIDTLGLQTRLEAEGQFVPGENFEALYSRLISGGEHEELVKWLEDKVFAYFSALQLPDQPTIYDHLVLSLRPKDIIATFNWDPFLVQALERCSNITEPPLCLFLHGNVAMGYCIEHTPVTLGQCGAKCSRCSKQLKASKLLYPVAQKNYTDDPFIAGQWRAVQERLKASFLLTFFGYGAPATDVEAVDLMKQGLGKPAEREFEETEIIDLRSAEDLRSTWSSFIFGEHYRVQTSFYDSILGHSPRRSVEDMHRQFLGGEWIDDFPIPKEADWAELKEWLKPYLAQEGRSPS